MAREKVGVFLWEDAPPPLPRVLPPHCYFVSSVAVQV